MSATVSDLAPPPVKPSLATRITTLVRDFGNLARDGAVVKVGAVDQHEMIFSGPARIWQFGASAAQTVFDAGRTGAQVDAAQARHEQQLVGYQSTVQNAFREVKDALVASRKSEERSGAESSRVKALRDAYRLAQLSYTSGESSLLEVLDAERGLLGAELDQVQAQRNQLTATADLFKALGGGWDNGAKQATVAQ